MRSSSILSFPSRGPWGDAAWRGNCSGHLYKTLFERLRPAVFVDPMVGSGTSVQVAQQMRIEAHGLDLRSGFNVLRQSILEVVGKPADLCLSHPPYWNIILYSGDVWGEQPHPDDLSRSATEEEFLDRLQVALLNQRHATGAGGYYGTIIGDVRKKGRYSSYQAECIARMPSSELRAVLIKAQHHVRSNDKRYPNRVFPDILHEYVLIWQRPHGGVAVSFLGTLAQLAGAAQRRLAGTWRAVVWSALVTVGGKARLSDLYALIADNAPDKLKANTNWQAKVRQTLQLHGSTFQSVERGVWRLAA